MKRITIIIGLMCLLVGCTTKLAITEEDAEEICLDAAGYAQTEVEKLKVEKKNGFNVSFTTDGAVHSYHVNENGIITEKDIQSFTSLDDEDVIEKKEPVDEKDEMSEEEADEYIATALANLGVHANQVEDVTVEKLEDGNISVKCTIIANGYRYETIINGTTGGPIGSSILEK